MLTKNDVVSGLKAGTLRLELAEFGDEDARLSPIDPAA
jgi:hypothetical protein